MTLSTTLLSGIVAMILIMTALFPLISEIWEQKKARLSISWVSLDKDGRTHHFMVYNTGNRPAAIAEVRSTTKDDKSETIVESATFDLSGTSSGNVIAPGSIHSLNIVLARAVWTLRDCHIQIRSFEFPDLNRVWRFGPHKEDSGKLSLKEVGKEMKFE